MKKLYVTRTAPNPRKALILLASKGIDVDDMDAAHELHKKMGCICFENPAMGIYFINDPDGYWIEIIPGGE